MKKNKLKKNFLFKKIFFIILVLLILISGCKGRKDVKKTLEEIRTGSEGITLSFLPNAPPEKVHVEQSADNTFEVVLDLKNKGAYPQPDDSGYGKVFGNVFLSGFDPNIITFTGKSGTSGITGKSLELSSKTLEGKSIINPNGGIDVLTFIGTVDTTKLNVEKYEPILLATACYYYETVAGPSVCIDPNPYSTIKEKKVCGIQDITLSNQGAPIAVIKIEEEALALRTQFKITIKNVGGGDVLTSEAALSFCDPSSIQREQKKIGREDIDKVLLNSVKISNTLLTCRPFVDGVKAYSGYVRLINGEGFIICDLPKEQYRDSNTAFTTPLTIRLSYGYRTTAEKKIQIKKESSSLGVESGSEITPSTTTSSPTDPTSTPSDYGASGVNPNNLIT